MAAGLALWALAVWPAPAQVTGQGGAQVTPATAPQRVVSINLCTDQLAMMLAAPGQLQSVTHVSLDSRMSPMAEQAANYSINHGLAEEIYMLRPDLVLAGIYTPRETTAMLERLGIPVAVFAPVTSLDDLRANLTQMGAVLHRDAVAQAELDAFDAGLAALRAEALQGPKGPGPRAALYYANGYTAGTSSLAHELLEVAGLRNAVVEAGYTDGGKLALETLAMIQPQMVITAQRYPGGSHAEAVMDHPVVAGLRGEVASAVIADQDWVCGTPFVLNAIKGLVTARLALQTEAQ
ncbi:ABC transporter substrate-binding protein [Rhodobacteraceae bacterium KMM 6894]|nr:ABC transporter substrate-binding protein [Rhodobacteraceae bacterium KMM 6894]